ncbi:MAG: sulfatase [Polyangiaceae bacterium]
MSPDEETPPSAGAETPRLTQIGEASAMALGAALLAAIPTVARARGSVGIVDGLLIGVALSLVIVLPVALLARRAARGFRGVVGPGPTGALSLGIAMWAGLSAFLLMLLAMILKAKTHHRGLGGATFGVFGAAVLVGVAVFVGRLVAVGKGLLSRGWSRGLLLGLGLVVGIGPLLVVGLPGLVPTEGGAEAAARAAVFDAFLLLGLSAAVLWGRLPKALLPLARLAALPLTACILVVGFYRIETSKSAAGVKAAGGVPSALLTVLEAWTDHDGDGEGAHFGGRDCDEGDPTRHSGAEDPVGDGRDLDCDGEDAVVAAVYHAPTAEPVPEPSAAPPPAAGPSDSVPVASAAAEPAAPPPGKPDIIVVTLDNVRADRLGLYGAERNTSPVLDALGKRAVVFDHAYAAGSTTQRALTPLVSGKSFFDTARSTKEWPLFREEVHTVAERMKEAGYATGAVVSFNWLRKDRGFGQGFDEFDEAPWTKHHPERESTSELVTAGALAVYETLAARDQPVFLWLHYFDAHQKLIEHEGISFGSKNLDLYDGEIAYVDRELGRFLEKVEASPRANRTVILVHGSHGEAFGEHDALGHDRIIFEEVARVPFLMASPAGPARRVEQAVSIYDVAPTVLALGGANAEGVEGTSLVGFTQGDDVKRGPVVTRAYGRFAVVDWPLKLHVRRRKDKPDRVILFDLSIDPKEQKDLSAERAQDLERMIGIAKAVNDDD